MLQAHLTPNISQVLYLLKNSLNNSKINYRLCGIVFAHNKNEFAKSNIISMIDYWNCRSKEYVDFFFLGYLGKEKQGDSNFLSTRPEDKFDNRAYVGAIDYFESNSKWAYKGNPTMLLCRGSIDEMGKARLDLRSLIEIDFMQAQKEGLINSVDSLFESIIRVSKKHEFVEINFDFVKKIYGKPLANSMIKTILENLPIDVSRFFNTVSALKIITSNK